ncbi:hypothetical protein Slala02_78270 [Streptomyces lavendulae subsp. lavendulae]|nr:hypothetical protein Slala01_78070 [Streptomyces lavendulae subsp. lavendulae]GLX32008.1 hypothetical protein Slala02_78270 [Streptomyces lavendulae subsp. lavendulae]
MCFADWSPWLSLTVAVMNLANKPFALRRRSLIHRTAVEGDRSLGEGAWG